MDNLQFIMGIVLMLGGVIFITLGLEMYELKEGKCYDSKHNEIKDLKCEVKEYVGYSPVFTTLGVIGLVSGFVHTLLSFIVFPKH